MWGERLTSGSQFLLMLRVPRRGIGPKSRPSGGRWPQWNGIPSIFVENDKFAGVVSKLAQVSGLQILEPFCQQGFDDAPRWDALCAQIQSPCGR